VVEFADLERVSIIICKPHSERAEGTAAGIAGVRLWDTQKQI